MLLVQVLASGLANATLVRSACSLLRQLANSDAIKTEIVDAGGLELLCRAVDAHMPHAGTRFPQCTQPVPAHTGLHSIRCLQYCSALCKLNALQGNDSV